MMRSWSTRDSRDSDPCAETVEVKTTMQQTDGVMRNNRKNQQNQMTWRPNIPSGRNVSGPRIGSRSYQESKVSERET